MADKDQGKDKTKSTLYLLRCLRDSGLCDGASEMVLMTNLILRADNNGDWSCFVGYDRLEEDTRVGERTLKEAARRLEKKELIRRTTRYKDSNKWFINAPLIREKAEAKAAAKNKEIIRSPFMPAHEDQETLTPVKASAETKIVNVASDDEKTILDLLRRELGDHPTYKEKNADAIMNKCVKALISHAGDAQRCFFVLNAVFRYSEYEEYLARLRDSRQLGGYLRKSFPDMAEAYENNNRCAVVEALYHIAITGKGIDTGPGCDTEFRRVAEAALRDELIRIEVTPDTEGQITIGAEFTHRGRIGLILASAIRREFEFPDIYVSPKMIDQALYFIEDQELVESMKSAEDPIAYFMEHRWDVDHLIEDEPAA